MLIFVEARNKTRPRRLVGRVVIHLWVGRSVLLNEIKPNVAAVCCRRQPVARRVGGPSGWNA